MDRRQRPLAARREVAVAATELGAVDDELAESRTLGRAERDRPSQRRVRRPRSIVAREVIGHGVTRTPWTIGSGPRHAPLADAIASPTSSPAVVHVLPIATTMRRGGGSTPAATCCASSSAAVIAPNVPTGVAPPGGITIAPRLRPTASAASGTSATERRRTIGQPVAISARAFSAAHSLYGCGNTITPASSPAAGACSTVAIAWLLPYAPIAQIRFAPRARA